MRLVLPLFVASLLYSLPAFAEPGLDQAPSVATPELQLSPALKTPSDLWARIRNDFALTPPDNQPLVQQFEDWYANHPSSIDHLIENSKRYLYFVVDEVEKRGMPSEIALVPMIESGFNPLAYSPRHAAGLWQLLPGTGRNFGLLRGPGYDGRRDIVAATDAALKYFSYLHNMFGDWELALAAYNSGEGTVMRMLKNNPSATAAMLPLSSETRQFYARLIAIRNVIAEPEKFGIELEPIHNHPYFTQVEAKRDIDVKLAARLAEVPVDEFIALNAGSTRSIWKAGDSHHLLLPTDKATVFAANLESHTGPLTSKAQGANQASRYRVKAGDSWAGIAKKSGLSVAELKALNPKRASLTRGQTLLLATAKNETGNRPANRTLYRVKRGDTIAGIARRFGIRANDIERWNKLTRVHHLSPGKKVTLYLADD